jgi:hypothetical protein
VWCPTKELISKKLKWKWGEPNPSSGKCVSIQLGGTNPGLFLDNCNNQKPSIGELIPNYYESKHTVSYCYKEVIQKYLP